MIRAFLTIKDARLREALVALVEGLNWTPFVGPWVVGLKV